MAITTGPVHHITLTVGDVASDLAAFKLHVLAFRDPDNIQVELAASY